MFSVAAPKVVSAKEPFLEVGSSTDAFSIFILAIRSPVTREKYIQRLGYFFDFLGIPRIDDSGSTIP